ncbi:MAG: Kelch repeat-containing protein [Betaproteobacteria bacterium]
MPTTNGNRKILDLKRWEFCAPLPAATVAGSFIASSRHFRQQQLYLRAQNESYMYNPAEDGWVTLPAAGLAAAVGAGTCGVAGAWSTGATTAAASLTATGGTTSTIVTNQTLARDLRGYRVHILAGPNAGAVLDIVSNTVGTNATITVATQASAFTASTVYRLLTPVWYVGLNGSTAAASFRKYDYATNTWTTLANMPASFGTDAKLVATPSIVDGEFKSFATGTATSATSTTLVQTGKTWTAAQWVNSQVRITAGTGAGQIRTITANTADSLTVATWTTTPDSTSQYAISGNDDFLYLLGNNAVTMYRYSITANTWSTLTPGAARAAAPGAGMSAHWVHSAPEADWSSESAIVNGRWIYSLQGAGTGALHRYDIAGNTWQTVTYSPASETFTTGSKYALHNGLLYVQKDATGRWFALDVVRSELFPWGTMLYPQGAAVVGDTAFDVIYKDGATDIFYVHLAHNTSTIHLRQQVI